MRRDLSDPQYSVADLKDRLRIMQNVAQAGNGDSGHPGSGIDSIQLGSSALVSGDDAVGVGAGATATGSYAAAYGNSTADAASATAIGDGAYAHGTQSSAFGKNASAAHNYSTAIGQGAATTSTDQIMLGRSPQTVVVPGTFSNPSARRLKMNIIPAPSLRDIFPELHEYEYIDAAGIRRLGYMADDLVGTDAERFVQFDGDGQPLGIDYLTLLVAQVAQLRAEITELKKGN